MRLFRFALWVLRESTVEPTADIGGAERHPRNTAMGLLRYEFPRLAATGVGDQGYCNRVLLTLFNKYHDPHSQSLSLVSSWQKLTPLLCAETTYRQPFYV